MSMNPIAYLIYVVVDLYKWVVIAAVIASWLAAFNVINPNNNLVRAALRVLIALTEPVFRPIRRIIPPISGLDLSPLVVFIVIMTIEYAMTEWSPLAAIGW